ncbi:ATP-binding protein [Marinobacter bryozoorum]|uniref:ATP-binding protein n=1 Tax=Marinobacter bryozoorum TaxID=256324 RepID=UPI00200348F3|nr:ATP-binding protein [Marinobacter bryozoorum]MCK7544980.1 ATP-binding protein [Marinobacter bryozoorum]
MPIAARPRSVRGMLLILLLPAGIGLMALAWIIHGALLERMSTDFVESRLKDEVAFLEHQIRQSGGRIDTLQTGDYFQEVFHHAFAIASPSRQSISPETWTPLLRPLLSSEQEGAVRVRDAEVPAAPSEMLGYRRAFTVDGNSFVVIVAEDMEALQQSQAELHTWTAVVSVLLVTLMVGSIWVGITLALRPVVGLRASLKKLQSGDISRINADGPEEFRPLVQQLNQLLDSLDDRLERSRDALANLSHSVKTPIAAVRQILEDTSRPLDENLRREMASRLDDIDAQLESEMRRSRFAGPQVGQSACPVKQARDLLWMLGRLYPDKSFELSTDLPEHHRWPVEEHDLNEILGNLLDNAGKWSSRWVELTLGEDQGQLKIIISDDGAGVSETARSQLGKRGLRLDEQTPGHGLGLAIVHAIVERYQGQVHYTSSKAGGLSAVVEIHGSD